MLHEQILAPYSRNGDQDPQQFPVDTTENSSCQYKDFCGVPLVSCEVCWNFDMAKHPEPLKTAQKATIVHTYPWGPGSAVNSQAAMMSFRTIRKPGPKNAERLHSLQRSPMNSRNISILYAIASLFVLMPHHITYHNMLYHGTA